jgi:two-component system nitrate/nitrite sensor histidine kinase NarX
MKVTTARLSLSRKLAFAVSPFLLLALLSTAVTLWVSWQLNGGAAAVNEAGRMRMQAYRIALTVASTKEADSSELPAHISNFDRSLALLRNGDAARPLQVPWDEPARQHFADVERDWSQFRVNWLEHKPGNVDRLTSDTVAFAADIDALVSSIESNMAGWTATLHLLQIGVLIVALLGAVMLLVAGYLFVLEPVNLLKHAIGKIQAGDFAFRVERVGNDEFGTLAEGFNGMAAHLQSLYGNLASKVAEKTAELEEKRERLESLYEVTALVARATSLEELAQDFSKCIMAIAKADGVALRWSDHAQRRYLMLAASGLPSEMVDEEQCLIAGDCFCGTPAPDSALIVIPIRSLPQESLKHCAKAGFETVVNVPIRVHERLMGEVSLFFHAHVSPSPAERSLLEALNSHLAGAMENLRLNALAREAAVSGERHHLSRELHDSIAQSLAFLKIQVQLMRDAMQSKDQGVMQGVLEEIDTGVRECYGDVRELLIHFRTRANAEDIENALATTLRKFELQTGLRTALVITGYAVPLPPDTLIQVLHIVQEALSNVRKHARASQVWLRVEQQPAWVFEVCDDGVGFVAEQGAIDDTHFGLQIMSERAQRMGAVLQVCASPGNGCTVRLTLAVHIQTAQANNEPTQVISN